jgi:hypothetical protein
MLTNVALLEKEIMKDFKRVLVESLQKKLFVRPIIEKNVNHNPIILIKLEDEKILVT